MVAQRDPNAFGKLIKDRRKAAVMNQEIAASFCIYMRLAYLNPFLYLKILFRSKLLWG
jgi:hypothetical protein